MTSWRAAFSAQPDSTHPEAPFGLVTLAAGTSEGHGQEMPAFRQAQMGGFSHAPNPLMPGVFVAAAHDLGDPCYRGANCSGTQWDQYHAHSYMGPIHPRIKRLPAQRLATAAAALLGWGDPQQPKPLTGPVFEKCDVGDSAASRTLVLTFDETLLRGDSVVVKPYNAAGNNSATEVLVNMSGHSHSGRPIWWLQWVPLNISSTSATAITVDLSTLSTSEPPLLVRYAWGDTPCCAYEMRNNLPCPPANCPIFGSPSGLPAMPFCYEISPTLIASWRGGAKPEQSVTCDFVTTV